MIHMRLDGFRRVTFGLAIALSGCAYNAYVKQQAGEFANASSDVIAVVEALPTRAKAAETDLVNTLQALDPNCAPADGHIFTFNAISQGPHPADATTDGSCRRSWDVLRSCQNSRACDLPCAEKDAVECSHRRELAKVARWCASPVLVDKLNLMCASGALTKSDFPTEKGSKQQKAYAEFSELAKSAAEYVKTLSDFAVARDKSSQTHVKNAISDLKDVADKVNNVISGKDSKIDEKTQAAVASLASLLLQWAKEAEDEQHIREQVATHGPAFEKSLQELSASGDLLQAYIPAIESAELSALQASLTTDAPKLNAPDRAWYMDRLSGVQSKIDALQKEKPISDVLAAVAKAHENLRRILAGNLTKEEEEALMRENIQNFVSLFKALKAVYELL